MGSVIAFRQRSAGAFPGEIEARCYFRICRFLFDRALAEGDAREAMDQVDDILGYPLPPFAAAARLMKERDNLVTVMVGIAYAKFVDEQQKAAR
jgi:hypothetical protein